MEPVKTPLRYYGTHACLALWKERPQDILQVYVDESKVKVFSSLLHWCAQQKKPYRLVPPADLEKLSDSIHHEGIYILARELPSFSLSEMINSLSPRKRTCLLYLDGVENPHNIGSILRTCAHFDIPCVLGDQNHLPKLSPSTLRIAKGGGEKVRLLPLSDPVHAFRFLQEAGYVLIGSSHKSTSSLYQFSFPLRTVIVLGSESSGLSPLLKKYTSSLLSIPGTGRVESLNVSVAASLFLGEFWRQTHLPSS